MSENSKVVGAGERRASTETAGQRASPRIASIDIFRGLTMLLMIFVNDLASVKGLPWWNYHAPRNRDAMTYVDMVFPVFLFIVGLSIPIAVTAKLKSGASWAQLWKHVIARTLSLLVLGLILANAGKGNPELMGIGADYWALLALLGAMLFWNSYGRSERFRTLFQGLKGAGLALMMVLFVIFRRTLKDGSVGWIDTSYWEILGLIGWTYLALCILYIPTRKWKWAPGAWCLVLLMLNVATVANWIHWPGHVPLYIWPFGSGALPLVGMAGVLTSNLFWADGGVLTVRQKMVQVLPLAAMALVAGMVLTPLGISKIRATPTWCLYSIAASIFIFAALYLICDVKKQAAWAWFVRPAGANTLTTYLAPDLFYFAMGAAQLEIGFNDGWPGFVRAVIFTAVMLAVAALLTRWRIRLRL